MQEVKSALEKAVKSLFNLDVDAQISRPEPQFGDYASNVAMQMAKELHKPPREIAEKIVNEIRVHEYFWLKSTDIAGAGFINFTLTDAALINQLVINYPDDYKDQSVAVEYSCPNSFKDLHAGHLYQSIAGDALSRLLERGEATVHRTNFGGDVGLHVAKAMWGILSLLSGEMPDKLNDIKGNDRTKFLSKAYVLGAGEYEESDIVRAEVQALNKQIYAIADNDEHDTPLAQIYWTCRQWSYDYFDEFYKNIQIDPFKYYPESKTNSIGAQLVEKGIKDKVFEYSDGAVVFKGENYDLHTRVFVTSSGLPTYETKDLGVIAAEYKDYKFDKRILITGRDQSEYMKVVYKAADILMPEVAGKMTHLTNGIIKFGDGKKMSSRLGNVTTADDVLDLVYELVPAENDEVARREIMLAAVKYTFLKHKLGGDIAFDPEESVSLQGNSGPYLQYALVRAKSILSKAELEAGSLNAELTTDERLLVRYISMYSEILKSAQDEYAIHEVCTYLYGLASQFNKFYEKNRVIGDDRQDVRLAIVDKYAQVLQDGLTLLGIKPLDKM